MHGAGIFPGLSNLFYKKALETHKQASMLRFGVRYKILSAAGKGMAQLMASTILDASRWIEDNTVRTGPPIGKSRTFQWEKGQAKGFRVFLPDLLYMQKIQGLPNAETYLSLKPTWIAGVSPLFNAMPAGKWTETLLTKWFFFVRGILFRTTRTDLCMSLQLDKEPAQFLYVSDAFRAAGFFVAACVTSINTKQAFPTTGFQSIEACFNLDEIIPCMRQLAGKQLTITIDNAPIPTL
jgi:hypothetical protein